MNRYARQIILSEIGEEGQSRISKAKVLVIGAGGLGCVILQYLAAAGVGSLGIADNDVVNLSNLHRQILYNEADIAKPKVEVAKQKLLQLNTSLNIQTFNLRWSHAECIQYFPDYDIIVDATDNFASRYLINDACVLFDKVLVFGAVSRFEGQVAVFNHKGSVNYRDIFPTPSKDGTVLNCAEAGVLGVLPGIVGLFQATEVLKIIVEIGEILANKMLNINILTHQYLNLTLKKNPLSATLVPKSVADFEATDYNFICDMPNIKTLSVVDWLESQHEMQLIDVREMTELPKILNFKHLQIPLSTIESQIEKLNFKDIVLVCKSGKRSKAAAEILERHLPSSKIYSLDGGIDNLVELGLI